MEISKKRDGVSLVVALTGRLDTKTSPDLETDLSESLDGVEQLVLDFAGIDYISSAGLRVVLSAQKRMNKQGSMVLRGVSETVMEVFELTGFSDILTIER